MSNMFLFKYLFKKRSQAQDFTNRSTVEPIASHIVDTWQIAEAMGSLTKVALPPKSEVVKRKKEDEDDLIEDNE